jgi:hypothetical protein
MLQLAMASTGRDDEPAIVGELFEYVPNLGWHNSTTRRRTFAMATPLLPNLTLERSGRCRDTPRRFAAVRLSE